MPKMVSADLTRPGPLLLNSLAEEAADYFGRAKAGNTRRAYRADWQHFADWCRRQGREPLPATAETWVWYLTELARTHRVSTWTRRLSALSQAHQLAGQETPGAYPAVKTLMAGIRRAKGTAPRPKKALLAQDL